MRSILSERPIGADLLNPESANQRGLLSWLQSFIDEVLIGVYAEWEWESLDGVLPYVGASRPSGKPSCSVCVF